jgi:hypothetical protein
VLEIHVIDMVKFRRLVEKDIKSVDLEHNPLHRWLTWCDEERQRAREGARKLKTDGAFV